MDGSLYQVDSEGIELVSLTADFLLSSSFKFSEDLTVVGGKEVATYGIDLNTGKVCQMNNNSYCINLCCLLVNASGMIVLTLNLIKYRNLQSLPFMLLLVLNHRLCCYIDCLSNRILYDISLLMYLIHTSISASLQFLQNEAHGC